MIRTLILGTAGHIDHGKTTLVKALTSIDCDSLPEEKKRGITIDIGFANMTLGDLQLGIVDVPGHERFIKNMLAGATGIDMALLVVAADDSIMPQTREHFEILCLLGLQNGIIAITKADTVDDTTRDVVALEIREMVQGSFLENAPIIATSAFNGMGMEELKAALYETATRVAQRVTSNPFRLAIDRAFVVQGHGTVITGSIATGKVSVEDDLDWHKADGTIQSVRVRGLANHGIPAQELIQGQRAAINLAGVPLQEVHRGQDLATPGTLTSSRMVTVRLYVPARSPRPIKHRLPVRLHIGTAEVLATVALLDADVATPGQWVLAQLFLQEHITAVWGQPFVLRDSSAENTLGGGQILQPVAMKIKRQNLDALIYLSQLNSLDLPQRVLAAVWLSGLEGATLTTLARDTGLSTADVKSILEDLITNASIVELITSSHHLHYFHADRIKECEGRILGNLATLHAEQPLLTMHDRGKLHSALSYLKDDALVAAVIDRMVKTKVLVGDARRVARADFKPKLSINQRKLKDKIVEEHRLAGLAPPEPKAYVNQAMGNANVLKDIFEVACAEGFLVKVTDDIFLHSDIDTILRAKVVERLMDGAGATVAEIRDALGTTRKYAVPICEYLDRIGVTKRTGDVRVLYDTSTLG